MTYHDSISKTIKSSAKNTSSLDHLYQFCGKTSLEKYYDLFDPLLKVIIESLAKSCDLMTKLKAMEQLAFLVTVKALASCY